jgi:hypothetical protein
MRTPTDTSSLTDLVLGKLSPELAREILSRVEQDPELSHRLDELIALRAFAQTSGQELFLRVPASRGVVRVQDRVRYLVGHLFTPVWARWGFAVLLTCILGTGVMVYSSLTPVVQYGEDVRVELSELVPAVRGVEEVEIVRVLELIEADDLDGAGKILDRFLRAYPRSSAVDYARLLRGGVCLAQAPWGIAGIPLGVDDAAVREGLLHLDLVVAHATSAAVEEEARWCRARGYLLLGKEGEAAVDLRWLRENGGDRRDAASRLLVLLGQEGGGASWPR